MKTRCLLVDDEPIAVDIIRNHIKKLDTLEITGVCSNAVEAFEFLRKKPIDLIFLDIQMPKITGMEFLRTLKNPPKVIVVSAYREYALEGFELDVLDYLIKPVSFERFLKAMDKYYHQAEKYQAGFGVSVDPEDQTAFIWIRADRKNMKVLLNQIRYVEGLKDYVKIYLENQMIISKASMKEMEEKLPSDQFIRIHRSYLVSLTKIQAFTQDHVEVGRNILPIGTSYKTAVMHQLAGNKF
jgi:DNA-binding LytR/AlgR family response regulator